MTPIAVPTSQRTAHIQAYESYLQTYTADATDHVRRVQTPMGSAHELGERILPPARLFAGACLASKQRFESLASLYHRRYLSGPAPSNPTSVGSASPFAANVPLQLGLQKLEAGTRWVYDAAQSNFPTILGVVGQANPSELEARLQSHATIILSALNGSLTAPGATFADQTATRNRRAPGALDAIADAIVEIRVLGRSAKNGQSHAPAAPTDFDVPSSGGFFARDAAPVNTQDAAEFLSDIGATSAIRRRIKKVDRKYTTHELTGYTQVEKINTVGWSSYIANVPQYTTIHHHDQSVSALDGSAILAAATCSTDRMWAELAPSEDAMRNLLLSYPPTMDGFNKKELLENPNFFVGFLDHLRNAIR